MSQALFERARRRAAAQRASAGSDADPDGSGASGRRRGDGASWASISPTGARSRLDRANDAEWADVVVTMGCGDACPYIPGKRYVDWDLPDPKGRPVREVRAIRDDIRARVEALAAEMS